MKATDLLDELRPPLDTTPDTSPTLERILLAGPAPRPSPMVRYRRPLVAVGAAALVTTGAVALAPPASNVGPAGIARAAADLGQPDVLLHFTATTTYKDGSTERTETWQTPDGRLTHEIDPGGAGTETSYDQAGGTYETYIRDRNEIQVSTKQNYPETFTDRPNTFGTIANGSLSQVGDLPALLRQAIDGTDPNVRHVGRTTVRGIEVDRIQVNQQVQVADLSGLHCGACTREELRAMQNPPSMRELRNAPTKTVTDVHDIYVRHDNALPVRLVNRPLPGISTVTDFNDVQKLTLDASTRPLLKLGEHPGARRTILPPFDDSKADTAEPGD
jgi:YD repeat-containing protein